MQCNTPRQQLSVLATTVRNHPTTIMIMLFLSRLQHLYICIFCLFCFWYAWQLYKTTCSSECMSQKKRAKLAAFPEPRPTVNGTVYQRVQTWVLIYSWVLSHAKWFISLGVHERTSLKEHLIRHGSKCKIELHTTKSNKRQQKQK